MPSSKLGLDTDRYTCTEKIAIILFKLMREREREREREIWGERDR